MEYINDEQIVNDAAKYALERHIQYSNSLDDKPSDNWLPSVECEVLSAYIKATITWKKYEELSEEKKAEIQEWAVHIALEATDIADMKWEAAKTLLGL